MQIKPNKADMEEMAAKATPNQKGTPRNEKREPKSHKKPSSLDDINPDDPAQPFDGYTIVLTGNFANFTSKEAVANALEQLGARVTTSISGKTDMLVYSQFLEDGREYNQGNKYKQSK